MATDIRNIDLREIKTALIQEQRAIMMRQVLGNRSLVIGFVIVLFLALVAVFGPFLATYEPNAMDVPNRLKGPSAEHWFGTDNLGRDVLSRIVYGAQISMSVGFSVALIASFLGLVVGVYASYYKWLDHLLMRIADGIMAFPGLLLALALMAALGAQASNVVIAVSIVATPYVARVVRSEALALKEQTFVEATRALGGSNTRIIWRHIAPNTLSTLIVLATFIFAEAIIIEAALSFLGAGVPPPGPSWGNILSDGKNYIFQAWWMIFFPGITIILAIIGLNLFGDGLRDLLDPHSNQGRKS
ncbi:MAG: ABC transporter permease [Burkholderiaceae bacterium]|nr:ABC transporter permease [Burkholderiaceae bacterium]